MRYNNHIYNQLDTPYGIKTFVHWIKFCDIEMAKITFGNITLMAQDHPNYHFIVSAYVERLQTENQKK